MKRFLKVLLTLILVFSIFNIVSVYAEEVIFKVTKVEVKEKSDGVIVNDVSVKDGTITNDIDFSSKDDYIKYNITFKNDSKNTYTIKSISDDNDSEYLDYSYDDLKNVKVEAGKEKTFELKITYKKESSNSNISDKKVSLSLTYEDILGNPKTSVLGNNPKTHDDIDKYIVLGIVSLIGLGLIINKKKITKRLMVIGIASSVIIPLEVDAKTNTFLIVFNNNIKVHEYNVTFDTNSNSIINSVKVLSENKVLKPNDPEKENSIFAGWYKNEDLTDEFDFNTKITKNTKLYAKWLSGNIVKYNANGGKYNNDTTVKPIQYEIGVGEVTKYSYTENIDETGKQLDNYGDYWTSANIKGTDRGDTSKPHVVTIPGAETITVDIYYNTEGTSWDRVYVIEGSHPSPENYTQEQIAALTVYTLGDPQTGTYTVNGNELTNMGHTTLIIDGDSVTFDFSTDSSVCGDGYGYYAIITGTGKTLVAQDTYEEPNNNTATFAGWYNDSNTSDGEKFNLNSLDGIVEVYAKWVYKITYVLNGGDLAETEEYIKLGDSIESLPEPTKDQSTFLGWFKDITEQIQVGYTPTDNLELAAKWETNKYTISFDSKGAGNIPGITKEYNTEVGELPEPTKDNCIFDGWYLDETYQDKLTPNTKVLEDKTYIARWVPIYNITYNANGGKFNNNNSINTTRYVYNILDVEKVSHTENVDDTGKKLRNYGSEWNNSNIRGTGRTSAVNEAHVITIPGAQSINIDVYYNGENSQYDWVSIWEGSHPSYTAEDNDTLGINNGERFGSSQSGSYTVNGNNLTYMGKKHLTINDESVTFGFRSDGAGYGKGYGYYAIVTGKSILSYYLDTYLEPTREGLAFDGWYKDPTCTQKFDINDFNGDIEVYAKWIYHIELDPNGGTVTPTYLKVQPNSNIGNLPTPTKSLHTFNGWFTLVDGGEKITNTYTPTSNMTLHAQYTKLPVWTITFNTNGGNNLAPKEILRGGQVGELPTPVKNGFLFLGWYTDQNMTTKVTNTLIPSSDVTYYANWIDYDVDATNHHITIFNEYMCPDNMNITVSDDIVCKRAETLHEEICDTDGGYMGYCSGWDPGLKHAVGSKVTYGNCGTTGTLKAGDAFTCDVNGDGKFNELTERFYYMSEYYNPNTKEYEDDTAVLMYYSNVNNGKATNSSQSYHSYDATGYGLNGPVTAMRQLPTTEQWSNVSLKNTHRQLLFENFKDNNAAETSGTPLTAGIIDYSNYAARLPHFGEINKACGEKMSWMGIGAAGGPLLKCGEYIFESTNYTTASLDYSRGYMLENLGITGIDSLYYRDFEAALMRPMAVTPERNDVVSVRPVIEVPMNRINY